MITIKDIEKHVKRINSYNKRYPEKSKRYDWLGFLEDKDLSQEVEDLFTCYVGYGKYYDWVNGNKELNSLIESVK